MTKIAVIGANGKMGKEVIKMVSNTPEFTLAAAVDKFKDNISLSDNNVLITDNLDDIKNLNIDIAIDFTNPACVYQNTMFYLKNNIKAVIGTTGLKSDQIEEIKNLSIKNNVGCIIAPNFSIGAILMMKFAKIASKYFCNAEIIEYHHNQKHDAPSGTSVKTAQLMAEVNNNFKLGNCDEKETIKGARGANYIENNNGNIQIHSVRMPGFVASQEVIFGSDGQVLKIHHDTINRECYMSGVKFAVNYLYENNTFIYGLENIL